MLQIEETIMAPGVILVYPECARKQTGLALLKEGLGFQAQLEDEVYP